MLERVNFNPYAFLSAPKVDGLTVVTREQQVVKLTEGPAFCDVLDRVRNGASFEEMRDVLLSNVIHNPNDPRSRYQQAMQAYLGLQHAANYYNTEGAAWKLMDLKHIADNADYTGMSDAEKVMAIYDRYDQAFGNFRRASAIGYQGLSGIQTDDVKIWRQFNNELISVFGSIERANAAYRTAQYGNMSDAEIRAEITAKYPPTDRMTLREFHEMVWEMSVVGVDDGLSTVLGTAADRMGILVREELLDKPLDLNWLLNSFNTLRNSQTTHFRDAVRNTDVVLRELFDVQFDALGNASTNGRSTVDFELLIRQLTQKYQNSWTVRDYEAWFRSQYDTNQMRWL